MRYILTLLFAVSLNVRAIPTEWTSTDECFAPGWAVCGSFVFDFDTGIYSDINLTWNVVTPVFQNAIAFNDDQFVSGDQYRLLAKWAEPKGDSLRLTGYDLSVPVRQAFDWEFISYFVPGSGSSELVPSYEPAALPGTASLTGIALGIFVWSRRRASCLTINSLKPGPMLTL